MPFVVTLITLFWEFYLKTRDSCVKDSVDEQQKERPNAITEIVCGSSDTKDIENRQQFLSNGAYDYVFTVVIKK